MQNVSVFKIVEKNARLLNYNIISRWVKKCKFNSSKGFRSYLKTQIKTCWESSVSDITKKQAKKTKISCS